MITKVALPKNSILNTGSVHYDYTDSFQGEFKDPFQNIGTTEIGKSFFKSGPKWIATLFALRNRLVRLFGLKTGANVDDSEKMLSDAAFEEGEQIGLFKVFRKTANEIIVGEDDKHLNFRVSLFIEAQDKTSKKLTVSTTVKFHNWLGRLYFLPVKPFHKIIVPTMLRGMIKNIETKS